MVDKTELIKNQEHVFDTMNATLNGIEYIINTAKENKFEQANGMIDFVNFNNNVSFEDVIGVSSFTSEEDVTIAMEGFVDQVKEFIKKIWKFIKDLFKKFLNFITSESIVIETPEGKIDTSIYPGDYLDDKSVMSIKNIDKNADKIADLSYVLIVTANRLCIAVWNTLQDIDLDRFTGQNYKKFIDDVLGALNKDIRQINCPYFKININSNNGTFEMEITENVSSMKCSDLKLFTMADFMKYNKNFVKTTATNMKCDDIKNTMFPYLKKVESLMSEHEAHILDQLKDAEDDVVKLYKEYISNLQKTIMLLMKIFNNYIKPVVMMNRMVDSNNDIILKKGSK